MFGSRSKSHIARQAELHRMRHVVRTLVEMLPEQQRNTPEVQDLASHDGDAIADAEDYSD
jgi:NTE family protein